MSQFKHEGKDVAVEAVGTSIIRITEREGVEEPMPAQGVLGRIAEGQSRLIAVESGKLIIGGVIMFGEAVFLIGLEIPCCRFGGESGDGCEGEGGADLDGNL